MTGIEEIATPRQIALITTRYETKKISGNIENLRLHEIELIDVDIGWNEYPHRVMNLFDV